MKPGDLARLVSRTRSSEHVIVMPIPPGNGGDMRNSTPKHVPAWSVVLYLGEWIPQRAGPDPDGIKRCRILAGGSVGWVYAEELVPDVCE